ncbi:MAG: FAD-dependent oxidoreductase [Anaerolineales bacterium]|nr:FAD-dependent oxidoreductase [Anaerolineales bacterium]
MHTVIIGAGLGGLTTGALLLKAGHTVTVLEAHVYAGGCAGTFFHQGYRFDAGATLVGGFSANGPHARLAEILDVQWPVTPVDPAWVTHLPDKTVTQWAEAERWREERRAAFPHAERFWRTQESLAEIAWDISSRHFPWPPTSARDLADLALALRPRTLLAAPHLFSTVAHIAGSAQQNLDFKTFVDAQLLIAAQTISPYAHALYGSAALDLPRRGVNHVRGGIGALAQTLVDWIRANGGQVLFRQKVERLEVKHGRVVAAHTTKGLRVEAEAFVGNLTPWALAEVLAEAAPQSLRREVAQREPTWGAFTLYLGLDTSQLPANTPTHHQVVLNPGQPLGETNSVFISLSEAQDVARAPAGMRAATLSTHTVIAPWLALQQKDLAAYEARKAEYAEKMLTAAERALPGLRSAIRLQLPGTPATFEFYTRRPQGMVGGFPQTSLFNVRGPATGLPNLWLVGDSIFPGQSTAGVTLGGWRVARNILQAHRPSRSTISETRPLKTRTNTE